MATRRTATPLRQLLAALVFVALTASACGIGGASGVDTTGEQAAGAAAPADGGPEYGASLEEFGHALTLDDVTATEADETADGTPSEYAAIAWEDLIPPGASGEEIFARYEDRLAEVDVGSDEATALYDQMQDEFSTDAVNTELEGQKIRLAGFVAPLTYVDEVVTEFLLVPTFGACIHVPPPPPNQTIMVTVDAANGLTTEEAFGAVWVEGVLAIESATTDLAEASYKITSATSGVYDDF